MVDGLIQLQLSRAALGAALASDASHLAQMASRAKARCGQTALHITRMAVQFHGAFGYTDECDVGFYDKRALHLNSWLGTASAHRMRCLDIAASESAARDDSANDTTAPEIAKGDADWSTDSEADFRAMVRRFLRENYPQDRR